MSNRRKGIPCQGGHEWEKSPHVLPDGFTYFYHICKRCHTVKYPGQELQKIQEYSRENLFLFVEEWVLLLLYVGNEAREYWRHRGEDQHISGITHYQKMLFLVYMELIPKYEIPSENPAFFGYKYGPFSARMDKAIDFNIEQGLITTMGGRKSSSKEQFHITDEGREIGEQLFNRLSAKQKKKLVKLRQKWDQKTTKSLCKHIYGQDKYKPYIAESLILEDLFPGRRLSRWKG